MGKTKKTGLGRLLVKHHNHMIQESKEKGGFYKSQNKKILQSVTEVSDIEAVIGQAEEAERLFTFDHPDPNLPITMNTSASNVDVSPDDIKKQRKIEEALHAGSLRVPRRPPWKAEMPVEELDNNEKNAFLAWRRSLARLEENEKLVLTPFEKNLDIWRQLWRVVERSDLLVMVVDARDPMFYRCPDLEAYALEVDEHKKTLLLINKADLLPPSVREQWAKFFHENDILYLFWSAKAATAVLEGKDLDTPWALENDDSDSKIYGRDELLACLQSEAEDIAMMRRNSGSRLQSKNVVVGFVGYPNVGKSSTINALVGEKRTGVTSTPGKTKHFQTLIISEELTLCDCPGLVFPSFSSSRYEMIAYGVLPIDRMTEHREAVQIVANRVPRQVIEQVYNVSLPKPKSYESQSRPPLASELLKTYCSSRGYVISNGLPDETKAARIILKDYIDGKLSHFELPPGACKEDGTEHAQGGGSGLSVIHEFELSDAESNSDSENEGEGEIAPTDIEHVMSDLNSFDKANGLIPRKTVKVRKESESHKHHKKPQRSKNRSWRVGNDDGDGDGMPVKVFRKAANTGPVTVR